MINSNAQLETGAMALIKMLRGGMFTLPAATRRKLGLKDGDYVQAVEVEEGVLLKPVTLVSPAEAERRLDEILSRVTPREHRPERSEDELVSEVADIIRQTRRENAKGGTR